MLQRLRLPSFFVLIILNILILISCSGGGGGYPMDPGYPPDISSDTVLISYSVNYVNQYFNEPISNVMLEISYDDYILAFVNSKPTLPYISSDYLVWELGPMQSGEQRNVEIVFAVKNNLDELRFCRMCLYAKISGFDQWGNLIPDGALLYSVTDNLLEGGMSVDEQLARVDYELGQYLKSNFTYIAPSTMKKDETFTIRLSLNPSLSPNELKKVVIEDSGLATSTAEPGKLVTESGWPVNIVNNIIDITPKMKAVLISDDSQAFEIQPLHDNDIQIVSGKSTTTWQWAIKAKKEGDQNLILVVYRLVKIDGNDNWREVETYNSEIKVKVTLGQRLKSLDWKWLFTALLIPAFWKLYDIRKKQNSIENEMGAQVKAKPRREKGKK